MVLKMRLARWGARNNPFFGIVLAEHRAARDGKHLERLGTYNPIPTQDGVKYIELNYERIKYWISVGAQPTLRVSWILAKANIIPPHPKLLQQMGKIDLMDETTWPVRIEYQGQGQVQGQGHDTNEPKNKLVLSSDEFNQLLEKDSNNQELQKYTAEAEAEKKNQFVDRQHRNELDWRKIKLDGSVVPLKPLTENQALYVLQKSLGI